MVEQAKPQRSRAGAFFAHPASLLLIGGAITALLSGLLVPYITRTWQNHDRDLEQRSALLHEALGVKSNVVSQIGSATSDFLGASQAQAYETPKSTVGLTTYDKAYGKWSVASAQIASQLAAYLPRASLRWKYFSDNMRNTYLLLRAHPGDERASWLDLVRKYIDKGTPFGKGVLDKPLIEDSRNQTYEGALRSLVREIQRKEASLVSFVVQTPSTLETLKAR